MSDIESGQMNSERFVKANENNYQINEIEHLSQIYPD